MGEQSVEPAPAGPEPAGGVDPGPAPGLALGAGAVAVLVVFFGLNPYLVNLYGPFGEHAAVGLLVSLPSPSSWGAGGDSGDRCPGAALDVGRRRPAGGLAALVVVAFPTQIDRHESFVPQPNERSSCLGVTFRQYPPDTFDAATEVYCVGLERPLPAG